MNRKILIYFFLVAATVGTFWSVKDHAFIRYDDPEYVFENKVVCNGISMENVKWAFKSTQFASWSPLTWLSHMLDCQLFGVDQPGRHHLTSLLLHVFNTILMFLVFYRLTGAVWRSAFVAMLFALHPVHAESVAWISDRKDVLSMIFWLILILSYHQYTKIGSWRWYIMALIFLALGLMAKPILVTAPFLLLLLDYWPLKRFRKGFLKSQKIPAGSPGAKDKPKPLPDRSGLAVSQLIIEKIPMFLIVFAASVVTYIVQKAGGAVDTHASLLHRLSIVLTAYVRYIGHTFWPTNLSLLYPNYEGMFKPWQVFGAAVVLLSLTSLVFMLRRKRYLVTGWLWFLGTLVPVIGFIKFSEHSMADRFMYMPMTGLLVMVSWGMVDLCQRCSNSRLLVGIGAAVAIGACLVLTPVQVGKWKDSYTIFNHAVQVTRNNYVMLTHLGTALKAKGQTSGAIRRYREALRIKPDHLYANNNLGNILAANGRSGEAIIHFRRALQFQPNSPRIHNNMGSALISLNQLDEAIYHFRRALELEPGYAEAHNNLGIALAKQNNLKEAVIHFQRALDIDPTHHSVRRNLERARAMLKSAQAE